MPKSEVTESILILESDEITEAPAETSHKEIKLKRTRRKSKDVTTEIIEAPVEEHTETSVVITFGELVEVPVETLVKKKKTIKLETEGDDQVNDIQLEKGYI